MGAVFWHKQFKANSLAEFKKLWKEFINKDKNKWIKKYNKVYSENIRSFHKARDLAAYGGSPFSWGKKGYLFKIINMQFKNKKELLNWSMEHHEKWYPGFLIKHKNNYIISGWVAE